MFTINLYVNCIIRSKRKLIVFLPLHKASYIFLSLDVNFSIKMVITAIIELKIVE